MKWLHFSQLALTGLLLLAPRIAPAESAIPKTCSCNDDCLQLWPYSGLCNHYPGTTGTYCGWTAPGIPCGTVPPNPDAGPYPKPCTCNDDCSAYPMEPFCQQGPYGGLCDADGPGTPCLDLGVPHGESDGIPCTCDDECRGYGGIYGEYCHPYQNRCVAEGPGNPCPRGDDWRPRDDWHPLDDFRVRIRTLDGGVGAPVTEEAPGSLAPREGCSCAAVSPSGARLAVGLWLLLLGTWLLLWVRGHRSSRQRD